VPLGQSGPPATPKQVSYLEALLESSFINGIKRMPCAWK